MKLNGLPLTEYSEGKCGGKFCTFKDEGKKQKKVVRLTSGSK
jgi:hypothetical protein